MLYPTDSKLLNYLKKMQASELNYVLFDGLFECCTKTDVINLSATMDKLRSAKKLPKRFKGDFPLRETLESLVEKGYLSKIASSVYQVTHDGWNAHFVEYTSLIELFLKGVLCPSVVSLLTTLITQALIN